MLTKKLNTSSSYAVWHITETEDELLALYKEKPPEMVPKKKAEWLATRLLVAHLVTSFGKEYKGIYKELSGKPCLINDDAEISITHSFPMAAAIINLISPCGIDIERPRNQLIKIQSKFLNLSELQYKHDVYSLCKIWICKEVLYKIFGDLQPNFKDDMRVEIHSEKEATGVVMKSKKEQKITLIIEPIFNYFIAYSI